MATTTTRIRAKRGIDMSEYCREMYLNEYIESLNIEEDLKKRMLDLYNQEKEWSEKVSEYLHNCHKRIDELEKTVIELSTELGKEKRFIREKMGNGYND